MEVDIWGWLTCRIRAKRWIVQLMTLCVVDSQTALPPCEARTVCIRRVLQGGDCGYRQTSLQERRV